MHEHEYNYELNARKKYEENVKRRKLFLVRRQKSIGLKENMYVTHKFRYGIPKDICSLDKHTYVYLPHVLHFDITVLVFMLSSG